MAYLEVCQELGALAALGNRSIRDHRTGDGIRAEPAEGCEVRLSPVSGPAKTYLSRQHRDFLQCAGEHLAAKLDGDRRTKER